MDLENRARRQSTWILVALTIIAVAALWRLLHLPIAWSEARIGAILLLVALVSELFPVRFARHGMRITFNLPCLCGIAVAMGPLTAVMGDMGLVVVAAAANSIVQRRRFDRHAFFNNLAVSMAVSLVAAGTFSLIAEPGARQRMFCLAALAFAACYTVLNAAVVVYGLADRTSRTLAINLVRAYPLLLVEFAFYVLMSGAAAVLVLQKLDYALALLIVPILMLRRVMLLKQKSIDRHYDAIVTLSAMLQHAHPSTEAHLRRVGTLAEQVALNLGLGFTKARMLREAAAIHDLGKIAVDEEVLDKPSRLTDREMDHVRQHAECGALILSQSELFRPIVPWVRWHHERPDGRGYPDRLRDFEIPIESKIIAVVDAFDAMVGGPEQADRRPYREPMTTGDALVELRRCSGTQFDTSVVEAFCEIVTGGGRHAWNS